MKKKRLNEGLTDAIVGAIMTWATKKEIRNDPEFQKRMKDYTTEIAAISADIEQSIKNIEKRHGPVDRHPTFFHDKNE